MLRRRSTFAALALSATLLTACGGGGIGDAFDSRQNAGPCPPAASVYQAARIVELEGGENFTDITYTGEITGVRLYCRYAETDPLSAELEIDFAFGKGPKGTADRHDYTYFVAITRRNGNVLAKEFFNLEADFSDSIVNAQQELIRNITIPRADETISGANFEVLVGFELTEDQLTFNREGKRFRLDAQNES